MANENKYEDEIWGNYLADKRIVESIYYLQESLKKLNEAKEENENG